MELVMEQRATPTQAASASRRVIYLPREHGATAMLLTPIVGVAILARQWRWCELATLAAAFAAMAAKDPLVVVLRQKFVWRQPHPETAVAARWLAIWTLVLALSGLLLLFAWPLKEFVGMVLGVGGFAALALLVNLENRQRNTLFQIASAAALTSTSLATCISATGSVARWCWWFWGLTMLQAAAGILVVHARLDARIALRTPRPPDSPFRGAAIATLGVILCAAVVAAVMRQPWIASALLVALAGYGYDLRRQRDAAALQLPLKKVGQRALALSAVFSGLLILGMW